MTPHDLPSGASRREMRKTLIRLRLEMHRQEIRNESAQLLSPINRLRGVGNSLQDGFGVKHAPLWGIGAVVALGFLTGKGVRGGHLPRLLQLGSSLAPLIRLFMHGGGRHR